ncbi:MAG: M20/M25/M40 family metallo-hydrolase [Raoultibacter sp.]
MDSQRLLATFFDLVTIDSPSRFEADVAAYCKRVLTSLGAQVYFDQSAAQTGSNTGNCIAHFPGTVAGHIAFSAHMDCVDPCCGVKPVVEQGVIRSAGATVLGADDKAGLAALLEALQCVLATDTPRPDITVVLTTCEELSLVGSSALAADLFSGEVPCFVLDADGAPGTIIVGAPYHHTLNATFSGKAAHAGVVPEQGISALQMAAAAICAMHLGRIDECTTANIGVIEGGREINIIAERCTLKGECRSLYEQRALAQRDAMTAALRQAADDFGGTVEVSWHLDYPGILLDETDPLVVKLIQAAQAAGLTPHCAVSGGGSDANVLGTKGAKAITLGIGMTAFHSCDEYISIADLEGSARFIESIIKTMAK